MTKKSLRDGTGEALADGVATAPANETAPRYWYETQERAFAPGIADGWPVVIAAPHTPNGRLVRRTGDPTELLEALKGLIEAVDATASIEPGRVSIARAAIAKAEGRS